MWQLVQWWKEITGAARIEALHVEIATLNADLDRSEYDRGQFQAELREVKGEFESQRIAKRNIRDAAYKLSNVSDRIIKSKTFTKTLREELAEKTLLLKVVI